MGACRRLEGLLVGGERCRQSAILMDFESTIHDDADSSSSPSARTRLSPTTPSPSSMSPSRSAPSTQPSTATPSYAPPATPAPMTTPSSTPLHGSSLSLPPPSTGTFPTSSPSATSCASGGRALCPPHASALYSMVDASCATSNPYDTVNSKLDTVDPVRGSWMKA